MRWSKERRASRLPKRFPAGTVYVVEGNGERGRLRVSSRYVILPGGRRIEITANLGEGGSARLRARRRTRGQVQGQGQTFRRRTGTGNSKKFAAEAKKLQPR